MLVDVERPCPYCGEILELQVDCSVERQCYIEDCAVCCQPMVVTVFVHDPARDPDVTVTREGD